MVKQFQQKRLRAGLIKRLGRAAEVTFEQPRQCAMHFRSRVIARAHDMRTPFDLRVERQQKRIVVRRRAETVTNSGRKLMTMTRVSKPGKSTT